MNYTNLFNTLHSEVISEDVKEDIVSKVLDKVVLTNKDLLEESINEANDKIASYVEALSLLVNSDITNEALEGAIDEIFANETQEVVDSVTEAFQEDVVRGILVEQLLEEEGLFEASPAPIGLAGVRRAVGEEPIQHKIEPQPKPQQPKQETQQQPKQETQQPKQETQQKPKQETQQQPKQETQQKPKQAPKEHLYVMKGSDGSYRGARTKEMKDTVLKARKEAQKKVKTETPQPKEVNKTANRIESNKIRTTAKLSSTGFREAIPIGQKKETDEEKIERLGGNPGAQAAVRNRRIKSNEVEGQQHLDLSSGTNSTDNSSNNEGNANDATQNVKQQTKKPKALSLKQYDKLSPEEQKNQRKNLSKSAQKQLEEREKSKSNNQSSGQSQEGNDKVKANAQDQPNQKEVQGTESQGQSSGASSALQAAQERHKQLNKEFQAASDEYNNLKSSINPDDKEGMKRLKEAKAKLVSTRTAYSAASQELQKLKSSATNESLINSLSKLFISNLSESSIEDICKRIAKKKEM